MRRKFKKYVRASSDNAIEWRTIATELAAARERISEFLFANKPVTGDDLVWDTFAEANNAGDVDALSQLYEATKQLRQAVDSAVDIYERQVQGMQQGDYIRIQASYEGCDYQPNFRFKDNDEIFLTKSDYDGARFVLHHSINPKEIERAQEIMRQYRAQEAERFGTNDIESSTTIKASTWIVTVGDVEDYEVEAADEDSAIQYVLDNYCTAEDIEEYEDDPGYIWADESDEAME